MGCPGEVEIGSTLICSICTHDPTTGLLTDADSLPIYRVYEDETVVPILTGTMAKLDDAGTIGYYSEEVFCLVASGFEHGKTYTIYIETVVSGVYGGISYAFRAITPGLDDWSYVVRELTAIG